MIQLIFYTMVSIPLLFALTLGLIFFMNLPLPEKILSLVARWLSLIVFFISTYLLIGFLFFNFEPQSMSLGHWMHLKSFHFDIDFKLDRLGILYAFLTTSLIGIILKFSKNYLHREAGYFRFILLMNLLMFGLFICSFSHALDLFFVGWELVGTTSVLLISYFYDKNQPVKHAFKALVSYRICDIGILSASALAHYSLMTTHFDDVISQGPTFWGHSSLGFIIGLLLIFASLAKAGQFPFTSWLPTAMEGPTPSSAIFYGALSIHLGPFLLLRFYPLISESYFLLLCIGSIGLFSAIYATLVGRTRSDAKTMLAFATISQVGIIYFEISLGLVELAEFHLVAHAFLRTYQFLRSASLIQDFFNNPTVRDNIFVKRSLSIEKFFPMSFRRRFYLHALHSFHLDFLTSRLLTFTQSSVSALFRLENLMLEGEKFFVKNILRIK